MAAQTSSSPLKSTCHCGAIEVTVPYLPKELNECQCTICRRYAAAWAYYPVDEVSIKKRDGGGVKKYIWGDKTVSFDFCDNCGGMCYWYPLRGGKKIGVNSRNMDPEEIKHVTRKVTFGELIAPVKDQSTAHPQDKACY